MKNRDDFTVVFLSLEIGLAVAVIFIVSFLAVIAPSPNGGSQQEQAAGNPQLALGSNQPRGNVGTEPANAAQHERPRWNGSWYDAIAVSWVLVVVTFGTAVTVVAQSWYTRRAAEVMGHQLALNRAYLVAGIDGAAFQDATHVFEVGVNISNGGTTPAHGVTFSAAAEIVPFPLPPHFAFPLVAADESQSVSVIGPKLHKVFRRRPKTPRVADDQVEPIKRGQAPWCLLTWGVVKYRDAFDEPHATKFAFIVNWIRQADGNEISMGYDVAGHNDSD